MGFNSEFKGLKSFRMALIDRPL